MYIRKTAFTYYSWRYDKFVHVPKGYPSDGATWAKDIDSLGWWVHDVLCDFGIFEDGTACNNWQASMILRDILWSEGYWFRSVTWFIGTWLGGGGLARKNGMY